MGGLFSCMGGDSHPDVYIDFDSVQPGCPEEEHIVNSFKDAVLTPSRSYLERFRTYQDAQQLVTAAIQAPGSEAAVDAAWEAVLPSIHFQGEIYDFSEKVVEQFLSLLRFVIDLLTDNSIVVLDRYAAVTKSFADCFDLFLQFDEIKLALPKLLGDLSFFRRTASRRTNFQDYEELYAKSAEMSMFFGTANPFLNRAINAVQAEYRDPQRLRRVLDVFASIVDICTAIMDDGHRFENEATNVLCLRCIVGAVLMFDQTSASGAFHPKTPMRIVDAVQTVVEFEPRQNALVNALKFSSKHLSDANTLPAIKDLLK